MTLRRQCRQNASNVGQKPHVEHMVGFVEDQGLDAVELHGALLQQVENPPGAGDDDVRLGAQRLPLRTSGDTAKNRRDVDRRESCEGAHILADLADQFAGRSHDEDAWPRFAGRE